MRKSIFIMFFVSTFLYSQKIDYNVGVLVDIFSKSEKFSNIIFKSVEKKINENSDKVNVKIIIYEDKEKIQKDFKTNKIELMLINSYLYYKKKSELIPYSGDFKPWTLYINDTIYEQYLVIKNAKSKASLKNIKNYRINFKEEVYNSTFWFKSLLYKIHKKPYSKIIREEKTMKEANKLILKAFFNLDEVSIVKSKDLDLMSELNPQIKRNIKVLAKSEAIYFTLFGLTNKNMSKEKHKLIFEELNGMDNLFTGSEYGSVIPKVSGAYIVDKKLDKLEKFFKDYFYLESKYEK